MLARKTAAPTRRGFTLLELLAGSVVTLIVLSAVTMTVLAVHKFYQSESRIKVVGEGARTAMSFIEARLRMAGYGVDPRIAFDISTSGLGVLTKSNYKLTPTGTGVPLSFTDDLAFRYRDPAWLRKGTYTFNSKTLTLSANTFGANFSAGQRLLVACTGGSKYLMLKVRPGTGVAQTDSGSSNFEVDAALSLGENGANNDACLTKTGEASPFVMLIHEVRMRIMLLDGRPYLMAFSNLESPGSTNDTSNAVPLAADVELFEVAYVMNRPAPESTFKNEPPVDASSVPTNWVLGDLGSSDADRLPRVGGTVVTPGYDHSYDEKARYNAHPANIRAVRVSISVRSAIPEPSQRGAFPRQDVEDHHDEPTPAPDGYYRTTLTTTVRIPNMLSRSAFIPDVNSPTSGNAWGG